MAWFRKVMLWLVVGLILIAVAATGFVYYQAQRPVDRTGAYVALGSSFAAGIGLGPAAPGSPFICQRTLAGYPRQLATLLRTHLVDMSCSGATIRQVVDGGQIFLPPQIDAIGPQTRLVTLTGGGNDVAYVGDLMLISTKRAGGFRGWLADMFAADPLPVDRRPFSQLSATMTRTIAAIRQRAPQARIVIITYPAILPATGTCPALGLSDAEAQLMRAVGARLDQLTRKVARDENILSVDMANLSQGHDVCSDEPWVLGAFPSNGTAFHPNAAGASAMARATAAALGLDARLAAAVGGAVAQP
jgi:lysophospholipase L1-like esterase